MCELVQKYNVPGPRYTSYPSVPFWDIESFSGKKWKAGLRQSFDESNVRDGISMYIHLPFCESMCTFCGCHKRITKRHDLEEPYVRTLLKEWALYRQLFGSRPKIKELHIGGGTPTFFSPDNLRRLVEGILRRADRAEDFSFSFEGHPNNTTEAHLKALYDLGFTRVSYGVQDYNLSVQKAINRIQPYSKVKEVTELARSIGYTSVGHDLVFGLPHQTLDHIEETIATTKELRPDRVAFYSYAHVPWLKGNGQRGFKDTDLPSAEEKLTQYSQGKRMLARAGYQEVGMDHFALKEDSLYQAMQSENLHRNFMGYTDMRTEVMVGLGVSAIGENANGFAQNSKSLEAYEHLVENGILPIFRGHILSDEDKVIRQHILNLMCHFNTSNNGNNLHFSEWGTALDRLEEMASDGLLEIRDNKIQVTEEGRPYVRNISMAFDLRMHRKQPDTRIFSMTI